MEKQKDEQGSWRFATSAVHAGFQPDPTTGALPTPIYQTSTFELDNVDEEPQYLYARKHNPTRTALQDALAHLEGGKYALSFPSGMAATTTLLRLVNSGEHIVAGNDLYGGAYRLFSQVLPDTGLDFSFVEISDLQAVEEAMQSNTKLIWLETPTNPLLKLGDIRRIADIAHAHDAWLVIDNTFASPALQQPLALGADFVVHSTTKYIAGHTDSVGGAIIQNDEEIHERLLFLQNSVGSIPGPMDCFLTLRGLRTLALRMDAHCRNGLQVAHFLADHPAVSQVYYPGLESHPQHDLAREQMKGPGGMISMILVSGEEAARQLVKETKLFTLAVSLGGVESLIEIPAPLTHASVADAPQAVDPALLRLSIGIEHGDDLVEDLARSLSAIS